MSEYKVEISSDNTITVGIPSTGNGVAGPRGEKGYSAYELAVKNGYTGTEAEWLATLKGEKGEKGEPGTNGSDGKPGKDGVDGANGTDGKPGANGLSAYELAAKNGFTGNEAAWLDSLKGDKGDRGPKGDDGQNGVDGKDGLSAYSIAVKNGYNGTEEEWVNKWLRGTIVSADVDDAGVMSMTDINGNVINTTLAPIAKAASSASAAEASAQAAATSANEAATHETNAATSLAETRKSEQNAKSSEQNAAASAAQAAENAKTSQADWNQTDDTQTDFIKNKPDVLLKSGGTVTGTIAATAFSGPLSGDVNGNVAGTADKAVADGNGNNIVNTYVTKSALATGVTTGMGKVTTLTATDSTLTNLTVTGQTTVPTANAGNSSKAIANTEFVAKSIAALVNGAPDQLNTLNELAKALGNDSNFAATVTAELAKKLNSTEAESTYATKTEARVLPGTVTAFSGTFKDGYPVNKNTGLVDKEWHLCDGTNGTPDLRNRFIYGGTGMNNGATGGEVSHTLTGAELPNLSGTVRDVIFNSRRTSTSGILSTTYIDKDSHGYGADNDFYSHTLQITIGGDQPHNNMPPYYVLAFMMKL